MVYQKLQKARLILQKTELKKSGFNKFSGYPYFELRDFLPAIQTIFSEVGLCGIVSFDAHNASLRVVDVEDNSEVTFTSPMGSAALKGCHEVQNIGAVETYQRRYLYVTAMEIVEHDALEATTGKEAPSSAKPVTKDAFDNLDTETQEWLRNIAMNAIAFIVKGEVAEAVEYIESEQLGDLKVALWSLFDSKQRSAMKAITQKKAA